MTDRQTPVSPKGYAMRDEAVEAATCMEQISGRVCEVYFDCARPMHKWTFRITEQEKDQS